MTQIRRPRYIQFKVTWLIVGLMVAFPHNVFGDLIDFSFWNQNGDSTLLPSGITMSVTGDVNTVKTGNLLGNMKETASHFVFDFDSAIKSIDIQFLSLEETYDRIRSFSLIPTSVSGTNLIFTGSEITASGNGVDPWDGIAIFNDVNSTQLSFTIESDTGSNSGLFIGGVDNVIAVPEPASFAVIVGIGSMMLLRRSKHLLPSFA